MQSPIDTRIALLGNPVVHSLSPTIFHLLCAATADRGSYSLVEAQSPFSLRDIFAILQLRGINVTAPFKAIVCEQVDHCSERVRTLGVANTIIEQNGHLSAYNTDVDGILAQLDSTGLDLAQRPTLLLGAGGAASAALYALKARGASVTIVNRTAERAKFLSQQYDVPYALHTNPPAVTGETLIFSCLPPGAVLPALQYACAAHIIDATYYHSPIEPIARANTIPYTNGMVWLIHQAIKSYELFLDTPYTGAVPAPSAILANPIPTFSCSRDAAVTSDIFPRGTSLIHW